MKYPIQKKSLADEVAARLSEQISLGQYKVNEQLPIEPELMKNFGVGRSTIREAIKILANSGLLRVQQGVGTFVDQLTANREPMDLRLKRANVRDLDEVRQLLEMKIAEKAALNRTDSDIATIKTHLQNRKRAAKEGRVEECIEADVQFHISIAEASKNEILADLYKAASIHLKNWFLQTHSDVWVFEETYVYHEQLLKSIIAGDPKKAWSIAAKILGHVSQ
ncbi:GntR family transcriptional regulator [Pedobacter ginsengisoli]|uniref:GntR family transcriptional regulator n=1 Tax=Pedobacter ginsengisoli TaxID=363852 RepID=A0A2D1U525_9SPHI|nr:FadR/GntR family transcriptional regulator [Pedobacter ginsengisoli]ATP56695.1 GntR family transcriptional regulator [Pedobacter ginsengisoli]